MSFINSRYQIHSIMKEKQKNIAIWVAIIGGGIAFYLFYGVATDMMR